MRRTHTGGRTQRRWCDFGFVDLHVRYGTVHRLKDDMMYLPHTQIGIFQTLFLGATPEQAYSKLSAGEPYTPFRDPSMCDSALDLSVLDIISVSSELFMKMARRKLHTCPTEFWKHLSVNGVGQQRWRMNCAVLLCRECTQRSGRASCHGQGIQAPSTWKPISTTSR